MNPIDRLVLLGAAAGFAVFLAAHVPLLRRFQAGIAFPVAFLLGLALDFRLLQGAGGAAGALSAALYGLLFLHFASLVFGMSESAVRVRILAEVDAAGEAGLTLTELYARYDAKTMLRRRMERLTHAGHLTLENGLYRASVSPVLRLQQRLLDVLKKLL
jgi:hypothetical protein